MRPPGENFDVQATLAAYDTKRPSASGRTRHQVAARFNDVLEARYFATDSGVVLILSKTRTDAAPPTTLVYRTVGAPSLAWREQWDAAQDADQGALGTGESGAVQRGIEVVDISFAAERFTAIIVVGNHHKFALAASASELQWDVYDG